jgi:hypothetical protein
MVINVERDLLRLQFHQIIQIYTHMTCSQPLALPVLNSLQMMDTPQLSVLELWIST